MSVSGHGSAYGRRRGPRASRRTPMAAGPRPQMIRDASGWTIMVPKYLHVLRDPAGWRVLLPA
jgi:hypothetical protein